MAASRVFVVPRINSTLAPLILGLEDGGAGIGVGCERAGVGEAAFVDEGGDGVGDVDGVSKDKASVSEVAGDVDYARL